MAKAIAQVPRFAKLRTVTANETGPFSEFDAGARADDYGNAIVNVIPIGGDNPAVSILVWSVEASLFIATEPPTNIAAVGVNTPWSFDFAALGRTFLPVVTAGSGAGQTVIEVAGHNSRRLG